MSDAKATLQDLQHGLHNLMKTHPKLGSAFMQKLVPAALGDGALTAREKELIALGIAVQSQCEPCIAMHVKKALDMGLTKEEIGEACGVAILMGGGPALMYAAETMEIVDELSG
jgi:AhpD family alkylhydroperoxidase